MLSRLCHRGSLLAVRHCATAAIPKPSFMARMWGSTRWLFTKRVAIPLPFALWGGSVSMQHYFGSQDDFFYGKFTTKKDTDALSEFYQAEDLLKIIAVHWILFGIFMNKVDPDVEMPKEETMLLGLDETHMRVKLLGMEVSFEITEKEAEINGETQVTSFMRHERFIDWVPLLADFGYKQLLWDQTWTFGFNRLDDGTVEVYHHGEKFQGPWPIRLIVFFHQYYVLWACEKYINGPNFGTEDLDAQMEELACLPLHVFQQFIHRLREEKEQKLQQLGNEPIPDAAAIGKATETLAKLKELSDRETSPISVVKHPGATGSVAGKTGVKVVAQDKVTQEVLSAAMKDNAKVKAAVNEVLQSPDLEFKQRPKSMRKKASS